VVSQNSRVPNATRPPADAGGRVKSGVDLLTEITPRPRRSDRGR